MHQKTITLLVGAGAVENAWAPVIKAINNVINRNINEKNANSYFAQLVYLARFYSKITHPAAKIMLRQATNNLEILKKEICKNLKEAQEKSEIRARESIFNIFKTFLNFDNFYLVSTNWDTSVEDTISKIYGSRISCLHIHGDINSDIYLPTEITSENYRSQEEEINFGKRHSSFINCLEKSSSIIIYGLSMSPLDAELLQALNGISKKNIAEVIIINPDHETVANNLLGIIDAPEIIIKGYCPSNLEVFTLYK